MGGDWVCLATRHQDWRARPSALLISKLLACRVLTYRVWRQVRLEDADVERVGDLAVFLVPVQGAYELPPREDLDGRVSAPWCRNLDLLAGQEPAQMGFDPFDLRWMH